jgi:hypothetical protein
MAALNCINHRLSENFAKKVIDKLSDEQLQNYGITDGNHNSVIKAIQALFERYYNAESNEDKKDLMLQNVEGFMSDLDNYFTTVKLPKDQYEQAEDQYRHFLNDLEKMGFEGM